MIIAHRGASFDAPENTLASIHLAWEQKADAVEVDIHVTGDEQLVVMHDPDTARTGNVQMVIKNSILRDLKKIDIGEWKGTEWAGERIPLLKDILDTVLPDKKLYVEIKGGMACLSPLVKLLHNHKLSRSQIILMDFDFNVVLKAMQLFPAIEVQWLYEFKPGMESNAKRQDLNHILKIACDYNIAGLNIENVPELDNAYISEVRKYNKRIVCWTVNESERAEYLLAAGIDGITTDKPGWLRKSLTKK